MKVKVLHVIFDLNMGGAQRVVMDHLKYFDADHEVDVKVLVLGDDHNSIFTREAKKKHYNIEYLNANKYPSRILYFFQCLKGIYNTIRLYKPDIIHTHQTGIFKYTLLSTLLSGVKRRVHTLHSDPRAMSYFNVLIARFAFGFLKVLPICLNIEQAKQAMTIYRIKHYEVIPNGVDLDLISSTEVSRQEARKRFQMSDEQFVVGCVGTLRPVKNFLFALEIFNELTKVRPESVMVVVGDGPQREVLERKIIELGLQDKVRMVGNQKNVELFYKAFDVLLVTSIYESFSLVTLEAQINNVKCIVSKAVPESVFISNQGMRIDLSEPKKNWVQGIIGDKSNINTSNSKEDFDYKACNGRLKDLYFVLINTDLGKNQVIERGLGC